MKERPLCYESPNCEEIELSVQSIICASNPAIIIDATEDDWGEFVI